MNYLAHAFLAAETESPVLAGNMIADAAGGAELRRLPEKILRGVRLHWDIDAFTDAHPEFRACLDMFGPENRRYAAVIVDILFDHFLALHWNRYSTVPLPKFAATIYERLEVARDQLSARVLQMFERMRSDDWLNRYGTLAGVERALLRLAARSRHFPKVEGAMRDIMARYPELEAAFLRFFPQMLAYARKLQAEHEAFKDASSARNGQ